MQLCFKRNGLECSCIECERLKNIKVGVVVPAWNEEKYLGKTLKSLYSQTLKPYMIVVVNDGSTDRTEEIAYIYRANIVNRPKKTFSLVGNPHEAENWNMGLKFLDKHNERLDYVMVLGADQILEKNYIEKVVKTMIKANLVIASGVVDGEISRVPRGSGRIYSFDWFKSIGFFPVNYGGESFPLHKALEENLGVKVVKEALSFGQRKTSRSKVKMIALGKGRKALGYSLTFMLGSFVLNIRNLQSEIWLLSGYLSSDVQKYEGLSFVKYRNRSYFDFDKFNVKSLVRRMIK